MAIALIQILGLLIYILQWTVTAWFVLGLLITFNVVSRTNNIVAAIEQSLETILGPILRPIRRIMPDTGMIDFSPMVLITGLWIIQRLLIGLQNDMYRSGMM
jgi:YggT family protein